MSMPRYSCIESALMTSPPRSNARSTARSDLPAVVAPTTAISMRGRWSAAEARHAEQHWRWRVGRAVGRRRGRCPLAGFPGVARAGAAHLQRGVVGAEVVRRGARDAGGHDVAGARRGAVRGEMHEAVVPGAA